MYLTFYLVFFKPLWYLCLTWEYIFFCWRRYITIKNIQEEREILDYQLSFAYEYSDYAALIDYIREYYDANEQDRHYWIEWYSEFNYDQFGRFWNDVYLLIFFFYFLHFIYKFFGAWEIFGVNFWIKFAKFDFLIFLIFSYINLLTLTFWSENFFASPVMIYILLKYYRKYVIFFDPYYSYQEMEIIEWEVFFSSIDTFYYSARRIMLIVYPITGILYALWYSF